MMGWPKGKPRSAETRAKIAATMAGTCYRPETAVWPKKDPRPHQCQNPECGVTYSDLHKDHIVPKFEGGTDAPENIWYICPNCHHLKSQEERRRFRMSPEQYERYMQ